MSDVSLIDGHIDGANTESCKGCTERHYNCHSECERYHRYQQYVRDKNIELSKNRRQESESLRREIGATLRRAKMRNERRKPFDQDSD